VTDFAVGVVALGSMGVLILFGLYVPIALILCSFVGVWVMMDSVVLASRMLGLAANDAISGYFFGSCRFSC
jgi:C4-dicarboxylate transporter DctM subunit